MAVNLENIKFCTCSELRIGAQTLRESKNFKIVRVPQESHGTILLAFQSCIFIRVTSTNVQSTKKTTYKMFVLRLPNYFQQNVCLRKKNLLNYFRRNDDGPISLLLHLLSLAETLQHPPPGFMPFIYMYMLCRLVSLPPIKCGGKLYNPSDECTAFFFHFIRLNAMSCINIYFNQAVLGRA